MNDFDTDGYIHVNKMLDELTISTLRTYYQNVLKRGLIAPNENPDGTTKICYYADPMAEVVLQNLKPKIEELTGKSLIETYSYFRVYQEGERLVPHSDRNSCEVSVTLNIDYIGEICPFWVQYKNNEPKKFILKSGDCVIYNGIEVSHWRPTIEKGQTVVQVMFHYVDKNGKYSEYALDNRRELGSTQIK